MSPSLDLSGLLGATGASVTELTHARRWRLEQAWREVFARATFLRTGKWRIPNLEWHVFSYGDTPCEAGAKAYELFQLETPTAFCVWPEDQHLPIFLCTGGSHLPLSALQDDIYVFSEDLAWTMVFTHEFSMGLGPYFARREWQPQQ